MEHSVYRRFWPTRRILNQVFLPFLLFTMNSHSSPQEARGRCLGWRSRILVLALVLGCSVHVGAQISVPANDSFSGRLILTGYQQAVTGSSVGATVEAGEPAHAGSAASGSVWLQWTAPAGGDVTIDTRGSGFDTVLAVYRGASLSALERVAENDDELGFSTSLVTFVAQAGTAYQIAVGGFEGQSGLVSVNLRLDAPPAVVVQPGSVTVLENSGAKAGFSVEVVGTPPLTFTWLKGGQSLPGANQSTLTITNAGSGDEGDYSVVVSNEFGSATSDVASLTVAPASAHDAFASRSPLVGEQVAASSENFTATLEPGEPVHGGVANGASLWWTWTAARSGLVTLDTSGSTRYDDEVMDTVLAVYTGASLQTLTPVSANNDSDSTPGVRTSRLSFRAVAGTTYQIAVASATESGHTDAQRGYVSLHLAHAPDNDSFANRLAFPSAVGRVHDDNRGATLEAGEPAHGGIVGGRSVWWSWVATTNGHFVVDTAGSSFDTMLAVYTGSGLGSLTLVDEGHGDPIDNFRVARVQFLAVAGTEYCIVVDGEGEGVGEIVLNIAPAPLNLNDTFANRSGLNGLSDVAVGSNAGASIEPGEPDHAGVEGGKSVWWSWRAPSSGHCSINTEGSSFDTLLAVYTGASIAELALVVANDGAPEDNFRISHLEFDAVAGREYQIAVDGYLGDSGDVVVNLSLDADPTPGTNDRFQDRLLLTGQSDSATGDNATATKEPGEPNHNGNRGGKSLWWRWVAPETAVTTIDTRGSHIDTVLAVYTGASLTGLTRVASDDQGLGEDSIVTFMATAGTEYEIAVDSFRDGQKIAGGALVLNLLQLPADRLIANDDFTHATRVDPRDGTVLGGNFGATREAGEPAHGGLQSGHSVWWSWTPTTSGPVTVSTAGSELDTVLSVYTGSDISALSLVVENDDAGIGEFHAEVRFLALAGTTYRFAVDGYADAMGAIRLTVTPQPNPPVAPSILVQPVSQARFVDGAGGGASAIFRVVAAGTPPLSYQWQHAGTNIDGAVAPTLLLTDLTAESAGTYRVVVTNALGRVVGGPASLTWQEDHGFNDNVADRIVLEGATVSTTGSVLGASKEPGEPAHGGNDGGRSVWWSWTAPASGPVKIDTLGSSFDTSLAVYTNASLPLLALVAENDDLEESTQSASGVAFDAVAGTEYLIAVDGFKTNSVTGFVELHVSQNPTGLRVAVDLPETLAVPGTAPFTLQPELEGVTPELRFQWTFNGAPLDQATNVSLTIQTPSRSDSGVYALVIFNDSMSISTRQCAVRVLKRQLIFALEPLPDGRVRIYFVDEDGTVSTSPNRFEVQSTEDPSGPSASWLPTAGAVTTQPGMLVFEESSAGGSAQRYYRVVER